MKRIASLLLAACLLAAPQLTGKAQAEGFALSDFGARGTALAGGMVARADDPRRGLEPAGITQLPRYPNNGGHAPPFSLPGPSTRWTASASAAPPT